MTTDELKLRDNEPITFKRGGKPITGTLNYLTGENRFQIIYFGPQYGGGKNESLDLTDEMIGTIVDSDGKLALEGEV